VACSAVSVLHTCLDGVGKAHRSSHSWTARGQCRPRPRRPRTSGRRQKAAESRLWCCSSIARPFLPTPGGACGQGTTCSCSGSGSGSSLGRRDWITEGGCCSAPFACRQQAAADSRQRRLVEGKCNGAMVHRWGRSLREPGRATLADLVDRLGLSNRTDSGLDGCSTRVRYGF
jgi:hypothetical protein